MCEGIKPQTVYCPSCKKATEYKPSALIATCPNCGNTVPNPFIAGTEMECVVCGAKHISDGGARTNWRCVELPIGRRRTITIYACPKEFPPDRSPDGAFKAAYLRMFRAAETKLGIKLLK